DPADDDFFVVRHRRNQLTVAAADDFAVVEIFVHDAGRRPIERVPQQPSRILGQRTDLEFNGPHQVETAGQRGAGDTHESGRESALRCEHLSGAFGGQFLDASGCRYVFGQIKIVDAGGAGRFRDVHVEVKRQTRDYGVDFT